MKRVRLEAGEPLVWPEPVVAIGNFDGVHRGHQALVAAGVARSRESDGTAVVLTFDPHPARLLGSGGAPGALTTLDQKAELLAELGVDVMVVLPFDATIARLTPAEFVRSLLAECLRARRVLVGAGFRFGHQQSGDAAALVALGVQHGFTVEAIAPVSQDGEPISSSRVRQALADGDVARARAMLGRNYTIDGQVVAGDGRGRKIGFPTANFATGNEIVPDHGVYAGRCRLAAGWPPDWRPAVVNVGERPTFGGTATAIEAHLLDFEGQLYGLDLRLAFAQRLRDERRFPDQAALVVQIRKDIARTRALLSTSRDAGV